MKRGKFQDPDERRLSRRYGLKLDVEWKLIHGRAVPFAGVGRTLDVSTSGVLFDAGRPLPKGVALEMSICWPARRNGTPLRLIVCGIITRSEGRRAAVRISRQEFRLSESRERFERPGVLQMPSVPLSATGGYGSWQS